MTRIVALVLLTCGLVAACPPGWVRNEGWCYLFSTYGQPWDIARTQCEKWQGQLAVITSSTERDLIQKQANNLKRSVYIGARNTSGNWQWVDGSQPGPLDASISNWASGKPNKNGNCAFIQWWDRKWSNRWCSETSYYLCKRSADIADMCDLTNDWHQFDGRCYKYYGTNVRTWQNARQDCKTAGGDLAKLETSHKHNVFQEIVSCKDYTKNVWIGASDVENPGDTVNYLMWVDRTAVAGQETNWDNNQPAMSSSTAGDHCTQGVTVDGYRWAVTSCATENYFVCEKAQGTCREGWQDYNGKGQCYRTHSDQNQLRTWIDAKNHCKDQNAQLMKITSDNDQEVMVAIAAELKQAKVDNVLIGISDEVGDDQWTWADGTYAQYYRWDQNRVETTPGRGDCGYVYTANANATWGTSYCFTKAAYICQIPVYLTPGEVQVPPPEWICPNASMLFGSYCSKVSDHEHNINEALQDCKSDFGDQARLTKIDTAEYQSWESANVQTSRTWTGLKYQDNQWTWSDGSLISFANWEMGQPANVSTQQCMALRGGSTSTVGSWFTYNCGQKSYFLCQWPATHSTATTPSPPTTVPFHQSCGPGWFYDPMSNRCFALFNDFTGTFDEARSYCQGQGSNMVSILGPDEQSFIIGLLHIAGTRPQYYIGLNDRDTEYGWKWTDGSPLVYFNWNDGEPNNVEENCVEISPNSDGRWNDVMCSFRASVICKKLPIDHPATTPSPTEKPETCSDDGEQLVSSNHWVQDDQLSASSQQEGREAAKCRIDGSTSWTPANNNAGELLRIRFNFPMVIKSVMLQGAGDKADWVTKFKVAYRRPETPWQYVMNGEDQMIFEGNVDQNSKVTVALPSSVLARDVSIEPVEFQNSMSLRADLLGCKHTICADEEMVSGESFTPDDQMTASSVYDADHSADRARIHGVKQGKKKKVPTATLR